MSTAARRVFIDHGVSGVKASRPQSDRCVDYLDPGDTLVSARLDRLGRSADQPIDTTTAMGKMRFTILVAFGHDTKSQINFPYTHIRHVP